MRKSDACIQLDIGKIHSDGFSGICRNGKPNVFVRNHKMPLDDLAFSMISNIAEDIAHDIEQEQTEHLKKDYKHRMAVNRTLCIGLLKSGLIYILLEKKPQKQDKLFQKLYGEIRENIVPVRSDWHYQRTKGQLSGNYSNIHKRSY